ncbi:pyrroloquinoline quinone biosynthesis protein PqqE [Trinickia caryophylli]|uniref:PqqA peptide cyclase n=1 Tax=Trinickia caryophylli TaxID=28094 RepID=A0A1X7FIN1_TRICW|nr:pyrroloquinoline quinone biosynthesis protein PqqE [Trinickia caryophylli]PMS13212.1 pyrroloquinoline quinone biosynthesis protein PqqE [Trinickia caryophylli]TRX19259.1 pyrroloquinoline quinone biosynthesis protein PqqE [Trinickia caryophylli]WQE13437.1 pyrroloquinoline quinone biosynthesis protein PqqE [Trinickia caryophylli]SMF52837.1 pyrroloquinoline quinone biosynthesis protein E [Trinickia caryophylli]GLU34039.1 coenzyme PQQ synthesis protein E [Trinickia caryophylli]
MPKETQGLTLDGQGKPLWLTLELTYRCPLKCAWCNNPLDFKDYEKRELSTQEWKDVLRDARALGALQLGFSGGEPLERDDLEALVAYADEIGYYTNLITSGIGLTEQRMTALKQAGLRQVQLSLQSMRPELTDELVGAKAHARKLEAARLVKAHGLPMVLNVPLGRQNIGQIDAVCEFAAGIGIEYIEFANIQYYNWALLNRDELLPTLEQVREAEAAVQRWRQVLGGRTTIYFVIPDYYENRPKACMNGWGAIHLTIAPDGVAMPCQEARVIPGLEFESVRDKPLSWLWHESPLFRRFRGLDWLREPCRSCPEKEKDFGGCRCQAFLLTGDAANTDPACSRSPHHHLVRQAASQAGTPLRFRKPLVKRSSAGVSTAFMED